MEWKQQTALVRQAVFESVNIGTEDKPDNVSPGALKNVLKAIHSRSGETGWCWVSSETLATDTGLSRSQVTRTLKALNKLCLLIEKKKRAGRSFIVHRRVGFSNLLSHVKLQQSLFAPDSQASQTDSQASQTDSQASQTDSQASQTDSQASQTDFTGQQLATKTPVRNQKDSLSQPSGSKKKKPGGWCLKPNIELWELSDPERVAGLYKIAVLQGLFIDCEAYRLGFFGLCYRFFRWSKKTKRNGVGMMHTLLEQGPNVWGQHVNDEVDRKWAEEQIRELEFQS